MPAPLSRPDATELEILDLAGKVLRIGWDQVKWVCYVRDFPAGSSDQANPERLLHKRFSIRPRTAGLWLRMTLTDGEELEGLAANDRSLIEGPGCCSPRPTRARIRRGSTSRGRPSRPGGGEPDRRGGTQARTGVRWTARRTAGTVSRRTGALRRRAVLPVQFSSMKLGELATRLGAELRGDAELEVTGVKGLRKPGPRKSPSWPIPATPALARKTQAAAVLVEPEFQEIAAATLRLKNPYLAFSRALGLFYQPPAYAPGIHPTAVIDPTAEIGEGAHIGAYVVVGPQVRLGAHATLLPHVVLYPGVQAGNHFFAHAHAVVRENCILGDHVTLENGAIIGADGFGFAKNEAGPLGEDSAVGPGAAGQPGRCAGQRLHRPGHGGRDARLATEPRWTTWSRWATVRRWARTRCSARRRVWLARR